MNGVNGVRALGLRPRDAVLSGLALVYSLPAWAYPFGNDQALHWYLGYRWLHGELPFVSGISSKPIGIFTLHMLASWLFGPGQWPIRVIEAVSVVATGWLCGLATQARATPRPDGVLGAGALLFAATYYTYFDYWDTAHPELWEAGCLMAALALAVHARRPWVRDAGAGALCGAAFMFKFPAALPALAVALACGMRELTWGKSLLDNGVDLLRAALRFSLGVALVLGLCTAPYALSGQLGVMWEILYEFIVRYAEQAPPQRGLPDWLRLARGGSLVAASLGLTVLAGLQCVRRPGEAMLGRLLLLAGCALLAAASVMVQGRYFGYHWVVMAPFCVALCLFALRQWPPLSAPQSLGAMAVVTLIPVALMLLGPRWERPRSHSYREHLSCLLDYVGGRKSRESYLSAFRGRNPLDGALGYERVAASLRAVARRGDTLCARGFATPLYTLTRMRCTSRHIVQEIVPNGLPTWPSEYEASLRRNPPTFMVTFTDRPRDLRALRRQGYHMLATQGKFAILSLREPKARPGSGPKE